LRQASSLKMKVFCREIIEGGPSHHHVTGRKEGAAQLIGGRQNISTNFRKENLCTNHKSLLQIRENCDRRGGDAYEDGVQVRGNPKAPGVYKTRPKKKKGEGEKIYRLRRKVGGKKGAIRRHQN